MALTSLIWFVICAKKLCKEGKGLVALPQKIRILLVGTLCATLEELYTERTGPQTHSDRIHTVYLDESRPKIFLLFSHLIDEKSVSFLTYLKSWWKVVLVFGKEHANWFKISWVMIGWSWKIKLGKIHFFCQNVNLKCQKCPFFRDCMLLYSK